ncbi:MAG: DUF1834 family protein [Tagaea sp.]|nr:DUF1834 family protein [Tagaea sp.]
MIRLPAIENAIVARLADFLSPANTGYSLKAMGGYGGSFDSDDENAIAAALKLLPAVLVNFAGAVEMKAVGAKKHAVLEWQILIATPGARGEADARKSERADAPGAYMIATDAMAALDGSDLGLEGEAGLVEPMDVTRLLQLRNGTIRKQRLVVYVVEARCTALADRTKRGLTLDEFLRVRADWDVPPHGEAPGAFDVRQNLNLRSNP